ncbi:MAG TPA: tail fiber domain-containing protein [Rubricoccaceae bacterium]|jgi:hypothetical protein
MRLFTALVTLTAWIGAAPAQAQAVLDVRATCDSGGEPSCQSLARSVFRVDDGGGLVAIGRLGIGLIPASGEGERMMWYPFRGAFRAGGVNSAEPTAWDESNLGFYSWAGGANTVASANYSFAMGDRNRVTGVSGAAFGTSNVATGTAGFTAGNQSRCNGAFCTAIGFQARAYGQGAVALGYRVTADADYAVAIGQRASANGRTGAFVIGDASTTDSLEATANNQFSARYAGGYRLYTNATETAGVTIAGGSGSWTMVSDSTLKEHIVALDGEALLGRLAQLPVSTWRYLAEEDRTVRHAGPMAQDWQRLVAGPLGLNDDETTINTGDFDGVNLAGVIALEARTQAQAAEIAALRAEVAALRGERVVAAERMAQIEAVLARITPARPSGQTMTASLEASRP